MRKYLTLKDNWYFTKEKQNTVPVALPTDWETVSLPHTWNALDGQDGGSDYYRGKCWYVRELRVPEIPADTCVYLEFLAASSSCEVYLNGKAVTSHKGGYSCFRADITSLLTERSNILSVAVDNQHQDDIYPQVADFTFYGGLYRDVNLLFVPKTHFDLDFFGANGLTAESKIVGEKQAMLKRYTSNAEDCDQVIFRIFDAENKVIAEVCRPASADTSVEILLSDLHLWNGVKDPYLYTITATLLRHNEVLDEVKARHGFREFHVDPEKGFFLNGVLTPLRGVSRHQDYLGMGNALTLEQHKKDAELIKEVGANTIRLAHYQHSQDFYDLCDEMGFVVWAEIPFISRMSEDPNGHLNCIQQMKELIYQNFNHSSICFWGISNEITIGANTTQLVQNLTELNQLAHELDSSRLTVMAQLSSLPMDDAQNQLTDVLSYNHYFGWYVGTIDDNEKWLDQFHQLYPNRALGISEYGCEGILTYHKDDADAKAGDYSEEYQALYHEHMVKVIEERPWLWATHIWNMFDFGCDARQEGGVSGRNNKGLVTIDRQTKKDSFYLYKAYWNAEPMVHICSKRYAKRHTPTINVKVYSNAPEVSLYVNGALFGKKEGYRVFVFENVPLNDAFTSITAKTDFCTDTTVFEQVSEPFAPYIFAEDASETGVTNWFDNVDLNQTRELTFRDGYYSIHDTAKELLKNKAASDILVNALSSLIGYNLKKSMLAVMGGNRLCDTASDLPADPEDTKKALAYINEMLQEIPKS